MRLEIGDGAQAGAAARVAGRFTFEAIAMMDEIPSKGRRIDGEGGVLPPPQPAVRPA